MDYLFFSMLVLLGGYASFIALSIFLFRLFFPLFTKEELKTKQASISKASMANNYQTARRAVSQLTLKKPIHIPQPIH